MFGDVLTVEMVKVRSRKYPMGNGISRFARENSALYFTVSMQNFPTLFNKKRLLSSRNTILLYY